MPTARSCAWICLSISWLTLAATPATPDPTRKDLEAMQGVWVVQSMIRDGEVVPSKDYERMTRVVKGSEYTVVNETKQGTQRLKVKFKLDATKTLKEIDLMPQEGPHQGKTLKGIYRFEDDLQEVCYGSTPDSARPKEFQSTAVDKTTLSLWKRADGD